MATTIVVDKIKGGTSGVALTLPTTDGSAGQLLKTNGSATLSWATDAGEANAANTAITTADQSWSGSQRGTLLTDNDASFDMNASNNFKCTVTSGTKTITFTNITSGQSGFILLINSGATMAAASTTKVDANMLATISTAGTYLLSYFSDGTNVYLTNSAVYA